MAPPTLMAQVSVKRQPVRPEPLISSSRPFAMQHSELTLGQRILLSDAEHDRCGRQFTFRISAAANEHIDRIVRDENLHASQLIRVLVREGAKSFLGIDIEKQQQAPAE